MRPQKINDIDLLEGLLSVIRSKGYDGSSLADLAKSTGLQKASLYHRFPDGKKEITEAVLNYVESWVDEYIVKQLSDSNVHTSEKLYNTLSSIDFLYGGGSKICILRALALEEQLELFGEQLKRITQKWVLGFESLGHELGLSKDESTLRAESTLVLIQGSLIVSKTLQNLNPFQHALSTIRSMYKG